MSVFYYKICYVLKCYLKQMYCSLLLMMRKSRKKLHEEENKYRFFNIKVIFLDEG